MKNTLKKLVAIALIAVMSLSMVACTTPAPTNNDESFEALKTELAALKEQMNKMEQTLVGKLDTQKPVDNSEALAAMTAALETLKTDLAALKTQTGTTETALNTKLAEINTAITAGTAATAENKAAIETLAVELSTLKGQANEMLEALNNKIDKLPTEAPDSILPEIEGAFKELKKELDALKEQIAKMEETVVDKLEEDVVDPNGLANNYAAECYEKVKYIDATVKDRDCIAGEQFKFAQKWIEWNLIKAGYTADDIEFQEFTFSRYMKKTALEGAVAKIETDGKFYKRSGWKYVESEDGDYVNATIYSENIVVTKKGNSDKQIIVGAHYDGDGTGDNGSGIALALTTAEKLYNANNEFTIVFVFFSAEEYGLYGATAYANAMTEEEIANTLYMINMDSLICGDYCYLYGGVQDNATKTVNQTEAYDNAMKVASELGISFKSNPWTWDNKSPDDQNREFPSYASPSTGDWSDHAPFAEIGVPYLYFEATNWEIPDYTGYGETVLVGMLMNTKNDYLEYIEKYFPGRPMEHLEKFSALLNALVMQDEWNVAE